MPLNCGVGESQPVHPKGGQSWVFIGRTDVEAETTILWPPWTKNWLIWKNPDAGKDWGQEEKGTTEDEMVGWHHQLNGHGFGWTLGVGDGQGGLACCGSWGCKESNMTEQLNWTDWSSPSNTYEFFKWFALIKILVESLLAYTDLSGRKRPRIEILDILDWPKCLFGFFRSPKYIFGQPNTSNRMFDLANLGGNG